MMSELLDAALAFRARGWHVFPTRGKVPVTARGHLDATTDPEQIAAWWRRCPWAGIGLACRPSGLVVVDIDPRNGGDDSLHDLERQHGTLPETPTSGTGGGGAHYFFRARADVTLTDRPIAAGVDIKANGYVVGPPSLHPSGRRYAWRIGSAPDDLALAPLPGWIVERLMAGNGQRLRSDGTPLVVHDGERNDLLYRLACALRRYGVGEAALVECLVAIDRHHSRPPLGDLRELRKTAASAAQYAPATSSEKSGQASQRTMTVVVE